MLNGTYRLSRQLKRGGMGVVYEATHARLSAKTFAVKVLYVDLEEDQHDIATRFRQEAEITSRLKHENIVDVLDYNETEEGVPYLVMELLEGEDLGRRMRRVRAPFQLSLAKELFEQAAAGLGAAHDAGVVHRDVKPSNLFLARRGGRSVVKVLDFGVSKIVGDQASITRTQASIGTPRYMAPEQARGDAASVDARADIFALSAIYYEMLAGGHCFGGQSVPQILYQICHEHPRPLAELRPDLPVCVVSAIHGGLNKRRRDRPQSMEALVQAARSVVSVPVAYDFSSSAPISASRATGPLAPRLPLVTSPLDSLDVDEDPTTVTPSLMTVTGPPYPEELTEMAVTSATSDQRVSPVPTIGPVTPVPTKGAPAAAIGHPSTPQHDAPRLLQPAVATVETATPEASISRGPWRWVAVVLVLLIASAVVVAILARRSKPTSLRQDTTPTTTPTNTTPTVSQLGPRTPSDDATAERPRDLGEADSAAHATTLRSSAAAHARARRRAAAQRAARGAREAARLAAARRAAARRRAAQKNAKGVLRVMTSHGGESVWANVYVDGTRIGQSPTSITLKAGRHRVKIERGGFRSVSRVVTVRAGRTSPLVVKLSRR
ncbi:MAG: hypothetical protein CSA65_00115 [Proteobacteria bacterium]|nr:MAG: hypothetical protein CSA65_00115 [Pseudomonadota bacterium]